MAISRISSQDNNNNIATSSITATYPAATKVGNLLILSVYGSGSTVPTIAGFSGVTASPGAGTSVMGVFWAISTGQTTVTASATGSGTMQIDGYEYQNLGNPVAIDVSNSNTGATATSLVTASVTTNYVADLVFSCCSQTAGNGGTTSWVTSTMLQLAGNNRLIDGQYIPGTKLTSFTDTASWATTRPSGSVVLAFFPVRVNTYLNQNQLRPHIFSPGLAR